MSYPILTPIPTHYRRAMIFDVETTGLIAKPNPAKAIPPRLEECPYIIQLSFVIFDLNTNRVLESYDAYIDIPEEVPIIDRITEITGITREIIREKGKSIVKVLEAFYTAYMKCDIAIAHNLEFDRNMIEIEVARNANAISESETSVCSIANMRAMFIPDFTTLYKIDLYCTMKASIDLCSIMTEYPVKPIVKYSGHDVTQVPLGVEGVRRNSGERSSSEFEIIGQSLTDTTMPSTVIPKTQKPRQYKKFPRLSELHQTLFGTVPENLHNSLIDVLVCLRCFLKIRCCVDMCDTVFNRIVRIVSAKHMA
jgi:DNA polymerase III epsilon subunit-like protein